jgi:hypothetical protein
MLPGTVDAAAVTDIEGHALDILGIGLVVIQRAGRGDRMAIGRMGGDVIDERPSR